MLRVVYFFYRYLVITVFCHFVKRGEGGRCTSYSEFGGNGLQELTVR